MNPLPQRKKTPEEIAKLREELGIPGGPIPATDVSSTAAASEPATSQETPESSVVPATPKAEELPAAPVPEAAAPVPEPIAPTHHVEAKPVRSLRKSERIPSSRPVSSPTSSSLPAQRRTEKELSMLRRSQPITTTPVAHLIALTAHPFIVGLGYFLVIAAAVMPFLDWKLAEISFYIPAILCACGLLLSGFIFLKKKRSLHHAGFIATIALLVIVFGALYYFPHFRNAP
jgi:hypothetical protein